MQIDTRVTKAAKHLGLSLPACVDPWGLFAAPLAHVLRGDEPLLRPEGVDGLVLAVGALPLRVVALAGGPLPLLRLVVLAADASEPLLGRLKSVSIEHQMQVSTEPHCTKFD